VNRVLALLLALILGGVAAAENDTAAAGGRLPEPAPSGRGGSLLPPGFLSTRGSDFVDAWGQTVRLACIAWNGTGGKAGDALHGLWAVSFRVVLDAAKGAGFNCLRIPFSDVDINTRPANTTALGSIDFARNPELKGRTTLQIFQQLVAYAGDIGLRIIFDHHTNDGADGQQPNGLWFDSGPGSDGTDGAGNVGTVTAATFQRNWVQVARTFAGNATVIGFDLVNEPEGQNWGQGGPTDILAMFQTVGNAIQAVNPGALIICEGDISQAGARPVVLAVPNKVVYSIHVYPTEISGDPVESEGAAAIASYNRQWGYLITRNIAPVWIGEMGASMQSVNSRAWAATLLDYMNGKSGDQGGPTFSGDQQPVSGSWWLIGTEPDEPNGLQTAWGSGHYRPEQLAVTDRLLFRRPPAAR
jgi:endoglucanase